MLYHGDDIGSMATSCTLCVISMNCAVLESSDCRFDKARLIECVSVNKTLNIEFITNTETSVNSSRSAAPVLMKLETTSTSIDLIAQTLRRTIITFTSNTNIDRKLITRLQHLTHVMSTR